MAKKPGKPPQSESAERVIRDVMKSKRGSLFAEEARQIIRQKAKESLYYLSKNLIYKNPETGQIGMDVDSRLHYEMAHHWQARARHRASLWLAPRGHLKTWLWTVAGSIWEHISDAHLRYLIINATYGKASSILLEIKKEWESNDLLRWAFPEYCVDLADIAVRKKCKWNDERLDYACSMRAGAKEGCVEIMGVMSSLVTKHFDFFQWDDPINDLNVSTHEMREKVWAWRQAAMGLREPGSSARDRFMGTNWHDRDMFQRLKRNEIKRRASGRKPKLLIYSRAALEDSEGKPSIQGEPIWPERFSKSELEDIRVEMGDYLFFSNYMNDPVPAGEGLFDWSQVKLIRSEDVPFEVVHYAAIDLSTEQGNDCSVISVGAVDQALRLFIRYVFRKRGVSPLDLVHLIGSLTKQFQIRKFVIETNAFQQTISTYYKRWAVSEGIYIPFEEVKRPPTSRKFWRFQALQPRIQRGDLLIVDTIDCLDAIEEEISRCPYGANDDIIDTFADLDKIAARPAEGDVLMKPGPNTFEGYYGPLFQEDDVLDGPVVKCGW